jgi:hypothetical protein
MTHQRDGNRQATAARIIPTAATATESHNVAPFMNNQPGTWSSANAAVVLTAAGQNRTPERRSRCMTNPRKTSSSKSGATTHAFTAPGATNKNGTPCAYAADVVDQRWNWEADAEKNGYWLAVGAEAKANNLYWGGTWKRPDWAHVQLLPNKQLKHIRRACGY